MHDVSKLRIIAFEGIDGSGKSTVIQVVADALRASGKCVFLPRSGKEHSSRPARLIRQLTRDRRNIELRPAAELALYCAREAQVIAEQVRPAVERGEVVLLDRSMLTPVVLGSFGRGLALADCEAVERVALGGLQPDLTIILDVDPRTSRIRKRLGKFRATEPDEPGRKGLAGSGLKERIREGYLKLAKLRGYPVFHTERVTPPELAQRVLALIEQGTAPEALESACDAVPLWRVEPGTTLERALEGLPSDLALYMTRRTQQGRALRARMLEHDPALVAWGLDAEDPLGDTLLPKYPELVLSLWSGRPLLHDDVRLRFVDTHPQHVIRTLRHVRGQREDDLRRDLAGIVPGAVVESLIGREDPFAATVRRHHWRGATEIERATSLVGCNDEAAWQLRESLLAGDPVYGVQSLRGVDDERVLPILRHYLELAPRAVLRALSGRRGPEAQQMRQLLMGTGREVVDSLAGLDDDSSWTMREALAETWPSSVLGGLGSVPRSDRWERVKARCADAGANDLHALRRLTLLEEGPAFDDVRSSFDEDWE